MSSLPLKNDLYLDQYFPSQESQPEPSAAPAEGGYESFDEDLALAEEDLELLEEDVALEESEEDFEEEVVEASAQQKSTMEWMEEHGKELAEDFLEVQDRFSELQAGTGEMKPEERRKQLEEVENTLRELESELETYADKEEWLRDSEVPEEAALDFEPEIEGEDMLDEVEEMGKELDKELDVAKTEETEAAEAEAKAEREEEEGRELKEQFTDALGYLNGSKDHMYFTAKVWGDKHIKDYHEDVTQRGLGLLSEMADAAASGDWDGVLATVQTMDPNAADNTLGLIGLVLSKHYPQVLEKIPSEVLEAMSDGILRGNAPDDARIYKIKQDGKYDGPKDDRRRKDMSHEGFRYRDAAELFQSQAEQNRAREEAEVEEEGSVETETETETEE